MGFPLRSGRRARTALAGLSLLLAGLACSKAGPDAGPGAAPKKADEAELPRTIVVSADRKDLVFSYVGEDQGFKTATSLAEVPEPARRTVVVTDLSLTPEERKSGRYVYLADLRAARADGTYPVAIASRYGFEAKLTGTSTTGENRGEVVVYSASWCGVCKRAKQVLKGLGVPYVEKDIEASRSAAQELAAKARTAGIQPGGVPVIDVGGVLLQGLDEPTLRAALKEKGFL